MERDAIITLPSGTEISVEAALGDVRRVVAAMAESDSIYWSAEMADLAHVAELIELLATHADA